MIVDIDYINPDLVHISYTVEQFKEERDYAIALSIMANFCAEFEIEPEIGIEEFQQIIEQVKSKGKEIFTVVIEEDGIEISLDDEE